MKRIKRPDLHPGADYTDEQLLLLHIEANIPAAKHWLYDRYAPAMYGQLLLLLESEEQATNVLVKLFTRLKEFVNDYDKSRGLSLFSWLLKKTREIAITEYPATRLTSNNVFAQFCNTLDEQSKQAFVLAYCKGLSREAIAERTGMDVPKINQILKKAMIAFRNYSRK